MSFDFGFIVDALPALMLGLRVTIAVSLISLLITFLIGVIGAVIRYQNIPILSPLVVAFVELTRNTPLLVIIFLIYFGLPDVGITLSAFVAGAVAIGVNGGAFAVENFRGGLEAVSIKSKEAGQSLGMKESHILRYIVLPIGLRISFPSFSNTCVSVIKNTSFLSGIGLVELTFVALDNVAIYFKTLEMFLTIGVIYLALVWGLSYVFGRIEKRFNFYTS